jgi:hypothetical protein
MMKTDGKQSNGTGTGTAEAWVGRAGRLSDVTGKVRTSASDAYSSARDRTSAAYDTAREKASRATQATRRAWIPTQWSPSPAVSRSELCSLRSFRARSVSRRLSAATARS